MCLYIVLRFVSTLAKLKTKGQDWKSTLLTEVGMVTYTFQLGL